ncbi:DUF3617 domain-containing protein [Arenimonas sp. MALMAid1274]|uniref:DUF3617 domain-containing protein n=1 Tax=Arenimonas sp. MALMAid1274 TaxID=3411630 RepID=UPI003BA32104
MKPIRPFLFLSFALGLTVAGAVLAQAGTGNLYRVTSKIEIQGMPMSMPSQPVEVCGPKGESSQAMVPRDKNCTVSDYRVSGNKSTFRMACTGENPMTATGEFERLGADAYRGRMQMSGKMEGEPMDMTMTFEGKKIRDCNYATESPQAQANAMLAKTCTDMMRTPTYSMYESFAKPGALCAKDKARYCSAITTKEITPDLIRTGQQVPYYFDAMQACGLSRAAVVAKGCTLAATQRDYAFIADFCPDQLAKACAAADPAKDYEFVVPHCPAQAQAAAAKHCAGRDFTAMYGSPHGNFCNRYAGGQLQQRRGGTAAGGTGTTPATPPTTEEAPKKPSWRDRLKSAKDKLTGED